MSVEVNFNEIYKEFYPKIVRYISRLTGQHDSEDITQEVFVKVSRYLYSYNGKSKLNTWLYRIATNTAIDRLRSSSNKWSSESVSLDNAPELDDRNAWLGDKKPPSDQTVIRKEMRECVKEFVDKLPPDFKTVIMLRELEGFKNQEIADILQISLATVKIRLHRARAMLKKKLNGGCTFYHSDQNILACDRKARSINPKP